MKNPLLSVLALTSVLAGFSGVSHAFDKHDCDIMFGSANVEKTEKVKIEGGKADFGDELHALGTPQGDAVICWSIDGRVGVKGKIFADSFSPINATVKIRFQRTTGQFSGITHRVVATNGGVAGKVVEKVSSLHQFNRLRIQLFTFDPKVPIAGGGVETLVATKEFHR